MAQDSEGCPYYYNLTTGRNTYDRPGGVPPSPPPKANPPPPPLDMVEGRALSSFEDDAAAVPAAERAATSLSEEGDTFAAASEPEAVEFGAATFEPEAQGWWANVRTLLLDYTQEMGPTLAPKPLLARSNTSTGTGVRTVLERC